MLIKENYSLKNYNTFHIDAEASTFIEVFTEDELKEICSKYLKGEEYLVLGGGSNILLLGNIPMVIKISIPGIEIISEDNKHAYIKIGAGVNWNDVVIYSLNRDLGGIENLVLIPGTAGAAPMQNIGAYGQELKDTFHSLKSIEVDTCSLNSFSKEECRFGYRSSVFKHELKGKFIITSIILRLNKNPVPEAGYSSVKAILEKEAIKDYTIKDVSRIIADIRNSKLPDPNVTGNAGSFFKNPEIDQYAFENIQGEYSSVPGFKSENNKVKLAAGWLIEQCGWKGKREGDAGAHKDQALVLVNYGSASGSDILSFSEKIKTSVYSKFGILLEEEVNIIR